MLHVLISVVKWEYCSYYWLFVIDFYYYFHFFVVSIYCILFLFIVYHFCLIYCVVISCASTTFSPAFFHFAVTFEFSFPNICYCFLFFLHIVIWYLFFSKCTRLSPFRFVYQILSRILLSTESVLDVVFPIYNIVSPIVSFLLFDKLLIWSASTILRTKKPLKIIVVVVWKCSNNVSFYHLTFSHFHLVCLNILIPFACWYSFLFFLSFNGDVLLVHNKWNVLASVQFLSFSSHFHTNLIRVKQLTFTITPANYSPDRTCNKTKWNEWTCISQSLVYILLNTGYF